MSRSHWCVFGRKVAALFVCLPVFALPGAVHAADLVSDGYVGFQNFDDAPHSWSGFYFGAQGGYQWTHVDFEDPASIPLIAGDYDADGAIVGGHIGFNYQTGAAVLGIEADIEDVIDANGSGIAINRGGPFDSIGSGELKWQGSVRARLGYAMDSVLLFATVGVAFGEFDFGYENNLVTDSFSDTMAGPTVGAGVELMVFDGVSLGAEYRYTYWGEAEGTIIDCCAPPPNGQQHKPHSNAVRGRVSIHIN